ncbi:tetratricopeptide repeat protein [Undibacterium sp. Tian12W]|uniref:tetratricopeptide repeat protein n=1 Tax=Undibacterium sp. Tian12W TaxID=3413054 RepID=UPI003BEFE3D3
MHKKKIPAVAKGTNSATHARVNQAAQLLQKALVLHQAGNLADAAAIYQQILIIDARHFEALQFLGMIKRSTGALQEAIELLTLAASINPANTIIHASLGNVLMDLERHADAIVSYDRFLSATPDFAEVLNNKANALSALGREAEAMACYEHVLRQQPDFSDAHFNRGNLYMDMRLYAQALADYEQVLRSHPGHFQSWNNRGNALLKLERLPEARQSYQQGLSIAPDNPELHACLAHAYKITGQLNEAVQHYAKVLELTTTGFPRQNAALQLAILHYVFGNPANVDALLQVAKDMLGNALIKDKGSLIYCAFMLKIQLWWQMYRQQVQALQAQGTLYVIGESHILSAHNLLVTYQGQHLQCKGLWIEGCTQWQIGKVETNHYQQLMQQYLQALPVASNVLISIGEIDCRIDSGILTASKKSANSNTTDAHNAPNSPNISLAQRVQDVIVAFLDFIIVHAQPRQLTLIISGVPAYLINENGYAADQLQEFGQFLTLFNTSLKQQVAERGLDFLDVFTLTDGGGGKANQQWHIDEHHLRPDAVIEAFSRHLLVA